MSPKLYHISEERNIEKFHPRISKKQWNYEKYVWAIEEEKLHNYLLPRECPRICVGLEKLTIHSNWLDTFPIENQKAIIFISDDWKGKVQNCKLFKYEFDKGNFKLIDKIAGYYVSRKIETPIRKIEIKNCQQELINSNVKLIILERRKMLEIKEKVVSEFEDFSIIRWNNLE